MPAFIIEPDVTTIHKALSSFDRELPAENKEVQTKKKENQVKAVAGNTNKSNKEVVVEMEEVSSSWR